jgi:tRNA-dihydrouridine synthase A
MTASALRPAALSTVRRSAFRYIRRSATSASGDYIVPDREQIQRDKAQPAWQSKQDQLVGATTLSLAPMMEYTDRHFRHLVRLISTRTLVYTEMVASNALAYERAENVEAYQLANPDQDLPTILANYNDDYLQRFLAQAPEEGPSVLQLGGSDPQSLYEASLAAAEMKVRGGRCDYTALNLNCGCPSPKVAGKGCFGAALMEDASLVADLTTAMHAGSGGQLPVTVKCRIGTDSDLQPFTIESYSEQDPEKEYSKLCRFVETVAAAGVVTDFQIHARIAVLSKSFSPADNRKVPPLKYDYVKRLVQDYPELTFSLNGGVQTMQQVQDLVQATPGLKGVMIGRSWAQDPWSFAMADPVLYGEDNPAALNRLQILQEYGKHADAEEAKWGPLRVRRFILRAISPLFHGEPNGKRYRIALDEIASLPKQMKAQGKSLGEGPPLSELILDTATKCLSEETLLKTPQESYERLLLAR